ncbi:MAG TPA: transcription antitermination factor NusB [Planctomycetota bacterium]|nr:transcription antitermination factor NusB [Planctomycetota bacterium]
MSDAPRESGEHGGARKRTHRGGAHRGGTHARRGAAPGGGSGRAGRTPGAEIAARRSDPKSERARAMALLLDVERGAFASELLGPHDGRFVRELVLGVQRRRLTLDSVSDAFGSRRTAELDDDVRAALRIGLYQWLFMDGVPPHAVVGETVGALRAAAGAGGSGARSYVNALLRTVQRESHKVPEGEDRGGASPRKRLHRPGRCVIFFSRAVFPDPAADRAAWLAALHSHPVLLVERWLAQAGEEAAVARMEAGNAPAPLVLRPRLPRTDARALAFTLAQQGVATELLVRPGAVTDALAVKPGAERALASRAFRDGLCTVQDPEQMDAAELLAPRAGEVIWDACAAPGGKTAQLAELLEIAEARAAAAAAQRAEPGAPEAEKKADELKEPGEQGLPGRIVATDAREDRLQRIHENVARLALTGVEVGVHELLSGAAPPGRPARGFDAVLLDAPCSNTAVLARRPEARWRLRADSFATLAALQRRLLTAAHAQLAPGGRLVYSVCTHEPEEGVAHGLRATRSPFVWTATHAELGALVAAWERDGLLADAAGSAVAAADSAAGATEASPRGHSRKASPPRTDHTDRTGRTDLEP